MKPGQDLIRLVSLFRTSLSPGVISGGAITDAGSGNVDVSSCNGYVREGASSVTDLHDITATAVTGVAIADKTSRNFYLYYNSGVPIITSFVDSEAPNNHEYVYLGEAHYHGTTMTVHSDPRSAVDHYRSVLDWFESIMGYRVKDGLILSETGTRNLAITEGDVFDGHLDEYSFSAFDSSGSDTFSRYYKDGSGEWTIELAQTQWENTKYDDGSGALADMTADYWSVRWIFVDRQGNVGMIYGTQEYPTQYLAQVEEHPNGDGLPPELGHHSFPVGYVVFKKGDTSGIVYDHRPRIGDGYFREREPKSTPTVFVSQNAKITAPIDTVENTLYSVLIPGGTLNANSIIRLRGSVSVAGNINDKIIKIYFGDIGSPPTPHLLNALLNAGDETLLNMDGLILNRGSLSSQAYKPADAVLAGAADATVPTSTLDTSVDQTIWLTAQKEVGADAVDLEYLIIEIL